MGVYRTRWPALGQSLAIALGLALAVAGLAAPVVRAQDAATPACGEVFGIGQATESCLRVINATAAEVGLIDVYVGETPVAEGVEYGQATEFLVIPSGAQQIRAVPAGGAVGDSTIDINDELTPGGAYQLTVTGLPEQDLAGWVSGVDVTTPPAGQARVRLVHAASDVGSINVADAQGNVPFEGIEYFDQSGDVLLDAGAMSFQVLQSEDGAVLLDIPEVQFNDGTNYDLVAIGSSAAGTVEVMVFEAAVSDAAATASPVAGATPVAGASPVADVSPVAADASPVASPVP